MTHPQSDHVMISRGDLEIQIQAAFMDGFSISAEGWNGEFGATVEQIESMAKKYIESALGEKK